MGLAPEIAPGALERLKNYFWQGNVRELENLVERELILHRSGKLMFDALPPEDRRGEPAKKQMFDGQPAALKLDEVVATHLSTILEMTSGKIYGPGGAAELLGINSSTLRFRLDKLGIKYRREKDK